MLAGGVAVNCVANGKILKEKIFDKIWIQPAGDAGGALGAALAVWYLHLKNSRKINNTCKDQMQGSYLGPSFTTAEIEKILSKLGAKFKTYDQEKLIEKTANDIANTKAIGWFQGRMEFGPRALGNRSILGDPRDPNMQKNLNLKVKFRESFRPFAPSILNEYCNEWFELNESSPYMLLVSTLIEIKFYQQPKKMKIFWYRKIKFKAILVQLLT